MPDDDTVRMELDQGELITMPQAGEEHGNIGLEIGAVLRNFVKADRLGKVYGADTGFRLADDIVRAPDAAFVRRERVDSVRGQGFAKGAPDLAVEVFRRRIPFPSLCGR